MSSDPHVPGLPAAASAAAQQGPAGVGAGPVGAAGPQTSTHAESEPSLDEWPANLIDVALPQRVWRRIRRRSIALGLLRYIFFVMTYLYFIFGGPYQWLGLPREPLTMMASGVIAAMIVMMFVRRLVGWWPARCARAAASRAVVRGLSMSMAESLRTAMSRWTLWDHRTFAVQAAIHLCYRGSVGTVVFVHHERRPCQARSSPHVFEPVMLDEGDPDFVETTRLLDIHPDAESWFDRAPGPLRRVVKNLTIGGNWFYVLLLGFFLVQDIRYSLRTSQISNGLLITVVFLSLVLFRPRTAGSLWCVLPGGVLLRGALSRYINRRNGVLFVRQQTFGRWEATASWADGADLRLIWRLMTRVEATVLVSAWMSRAMPPDEKVAELMA